MTQLDIVEMIGDQLTQVDIAIARLAPSDPNAAELTALRQKLDQQQQQLVKQAFDDNTAQFQKAAEALKAVNDEIGGSIQKIDQIAATIDSVNRFLTSATNLVATAAKLV
jgi:hypothetical protein